MFGRFAADVPARGLPIAPQAAEYSITSGAKCEASKPLLRAAKALRKGFRPGVHNICLKKVSDFTQQLSQVYEQHAEELQLLVANFRKRNAELRKERPACPSALFHTWETLLQEVEVDSQAHSDIASVLGRQVSRPLLERSFHRKIQSRKVFTHRESYETILTKTEDKLVKCRQDYKTAYLSYLGSPSTVTLSAYLDAHNEYVAQLHATNGMLERYHQEALPQLLQSSWERMGRYRSHVHDLKVSSGTIRNNPEENLDSHGGVFRGLVNDGKFID
ncbi:Uncharacterized protein GBIM_04834 [Gryllus bimaculatus]|nr:Uncharacterized protein GBIM_04834 [Gryllus bimaculatus]